MDSSDHYDCVVVGLGAMGIAAIYHLARRGVRVLGIEQFELGHDRGSSHGQSRVFRTIYDEAVYSELAVESLDLWRSLEKQSATPLLHLGGMLAFAKRGNQRFDRRVATLRQMNLKHEVMDGRQAARRFDAFRFDDETDVLFAERNGFLRADRALEAMRQAARAHGATVLERTPLESLEPAGDQVRLACGGRAIAARHVVVTAGPWLGHVLSDLNIPLKVTREQKVYFAVDQCERYAPERLPVFADYDSQYYGFPILDRQAIKVAADHAGQTVHPDRVESTVDADYIDEMARWVRRWMPGAQPRPIDSAVCLYTTTPDRHFILDRHPGIENVVVAGGFSGHGFKFSILVGDIIADLVLDGSTKRPIENFQIARFAQDSPDSAT